MQPRLARLSSPTSVISTERQQPWPPRPTPRGENLICSSASLAALKPWTLPGLIPGLTIARFDIIGATIANHNRRFRHTGVT